MADPTSWAAYFDKDKEKACHAASAWHIKSLSLKKENDELRSQMRSIKDLVERNFGVDEASLNSLCNIPATDSRQDIVVASAVASAVNAALGRDQPMSTASSLPETSEQTSSKVEKRKFSYDEENREEKPRKLTKKLTSQEIRDKFLKEINYEKHGEMYLNKTTKKVSKKIGSS